MDDGKSPLDSSGTAGKWSFVSSGPSTDWTAKWSIDGPTVEELDVKEEARDETCDNFSSCSSTLF